MAKESGAMVKREIAFFKKKGAPKEVLQHEQAEAKGKGYASGGAVDDDNKTAMKIDQVNAKMRGKVRDSAKATNPGYAKGGRIDGCAQRGKTRGMACGGKVKK